MASIEMNRRVDYLFSLQISDAVIDTGKLESAFQIGQGQSSWFQKLLAFFRRDDKNQVLSLMKQFGNAAKNYKRTDITDSERFEFKQRALTIVAGMRSKVSCGTLEDFDALMHPKLAIFSGTAMDLGMSVSDVSGSRQIEHRRTGENRSIAYGLELRTPVHRGKIGELDDMWNMKERARRAPPTSAQLATRMQSLEPLYFQLLSSENSAPTASSVSGTDVLQPASMNEIAKENTPFETLENDTAAVQSETDRSNWSDILYMDRLTRLRHDETVAGATHTQIRQSESDKPENYLDFLNAAMKNNDIDPQEKESFERDYWQLKVDTLARKADKFEDLGS